MKKKEKTIVYTSICMNYLPKALVLGESLKKYNPNIKFYVVLVEKEIPEKFPEEANQIVDRIILAKELWIDGFEKFIFKHSIVEASTSVKGQALVYLLENEADQVIYLDPDIKVYHSLSPILKVLQKKDIVLTPHLTIPELNPIEIQTNELCALQHGVYNLGFLAVKNKKEGMRFAKWWNSRLQLYCYDDIPQGIFTDQRWVDLAPAMFDVHILKNLGCNMAPWNLSTRSLSQKNNKLLVNDKDELIFFHYSGFDSGDNLKMFERYIPNPDALMYQLRKEYLNDLERMHQSTLGKSSWTYSKYTSGEMIENDIRKKYRETGYFNVIETSPFEKSNSYFTDIFSK